MSSAVRAIILQLQDTEILRVSAFVWSILRCFARHRASDNVVAAKLCLVCHTNLEVVGLGFVGVCMVFLYQVGRVEVCVCAVCFGLN